MILSKVYFFSVYCTQNLSYFMMPQWKINFIIVAEIYTINFVSHMKITLKYTFILFCLELQSNGTVLHISF